MFQVVNTSSGYIVEVFYFDVKNNIHRWFPMKNFRDCQGDALHFRYNVCPFLSDLKIKLYISNFRRYGKGSIE